MLLALKKTARPTLFGPLTHAIGKRLDHCDYSHGEILFKTGHSGSAVMGHGVRFKLIEYTRDAWDFWTLPDELEPAAHAWFCRHKGAGYDYLYMARFGTPIIGESHSRYGCMEAIMASLGCSEAYRYGPGGGLAFCRDVFKSKLITDDVSYLHFKGDQDESFASEIPTVFSDYP